MLKSSTRALRPDAQAFDEIRIKTIPRFKTSNLSGDEWRISAEIQIYRKGILKHTKQLRDIETACGFLYSEFIKACDDGKAYFAGEDNFCDQEGCSEIATVTYYMKKSFSREGYEKELTLPTFRCFCDKHRNRGDASLEDRNSNYIEKI